MMIHKFMNNVLLRVRNCNSCTVRHSALFINGNRATENYVFVIPHIDIPTILQDKDYMQTQLNRRKCKFDLDKLDNLWAVYDKLKLKKTEYDEKKDEISRELGKLLKNEPDGDTTKKYKIQISLIKDNIKKIKSPLWSAEETAIVEALKLPNYLHKRTPDNENTILYTHLNQPSNREKNHLKIGQDLNIINFKKNENYYLKGDAAVFELGAKFYFSHLLKENKFIQFSNPDFVKSVVVEGCGMEHTSPDTSFILHHNEDSKVSVDSRLHLTGGGSLCSFMAYHAKNVIYSKALPLKYFAMGRQYNPSPSDEDSLFHVSQSSVIEVFGVTKTADDLDAILEELIQFLKQSYSSLGVHFRLCILPADELNMWESLRVTVEMYSTSLDKYVEVANVSLSGDFISKRLLFMYTENKENKFTHIVSGTLLNVPKFLGCLLEHDNEFSLPDKFQPKNWSI
ncbi:hypothetical protein O3G_MSEX006208 [Manduca sexta]|uniref:serine--tRNA ligase n=1 Tax=Manduca sexta TaxID=7130 RepID=A0A921Z1E6_MANSE|nr:hypothetical protein O3G_MSEX006208 [Manduca sexta]